MKKKSLVIINPGAGLAIKQKVIEDLVLAKLNSLGYDSDVFALDKNFENNIDNYSFKSVDLVVAVGGDGTVKVAARTIIQNQIMAPLVIIPFGSANVAAISLGLPVQVKQSLKLLDDISKTEKIDVGLINNKYYFLVGFSVGYVSQIVTSTNNKLKKKLGFLGYIVKFVFNRIKIRKIKFEIKSRKQTFWVKGNSLIVFNALNYFGLKPKKVIDLRDGIFNLYVFTNKTFWGLLEAFVNMLLYNVPPRHIFSFDGDSFEIILQRQSDLKSCQVDGDYVKIKNKNIKIKVLPSVLEVVVKK